MLTCQNNYVDANANTLDHHLQPTALSIGIPPAQTVSPHRVCDASSISLRLGVGR